MLCIVNRSRLPEKWHCRRVRNDVGNTGKAHTIYDSFCIVMSAGWSVEMSPPMVPVPPTHPPTASCSVLCTYPRIRSFIAFPFPVRLDHCRLIHHHHHHHHQVSRWLYVVDGVVVLDRTIYTSARRYYLEDSDPRHIFVLLSKLYLDFAWLWIDPDPVRRCRQPNAIPAVTGSTSSTVGGD